MANPRGKFISFEGSEGCGKSSQIESLRARLEAAGSRVLVTREPGGSRVGEKLRHLLQHDPDAEAMCAETELLLFAASRAQLVREVIDPALSAGTHVIADRFLDSTTVYQGVARGLDGPAVAAINRFAVGDCLPDLTLLLDMDSATARARARAATAGREDNDRMEQEPDAFYEAVRRGYLALAAAQPERIRVLDAGRDAAEVAAAVWQTLTEAFPDGLHR